MCVTHSVKLGAVLVWADSSCISWSLCCLCLASLALCVWPCVSLQCECRVHSHCRLGYKPRRQRKKNSYLFFVYVYPAHHRHSKVSPFHGTFPANTDGEKRFLCLFSNHGSGLRKVSHVSLLYQDTFWKIYRIFGRRSSSLCSLLYLRTIA